MPTIEINGKSVTVFEGTSILVDGHKYRVRRGKVVQIPDKWVNKFPTKKTKRERNSISRRTRSGP